MNKDNNTIVRADISSILKRSGIAPSDEPEDVLSADVDDTSSSVDDDHSGSDDIERALYEDAMRSLQQKALPAILDKYKGTTEKLVISLKEELGEEVFIAHFKEFPLDVRSKLEKSDMRMHLSSSKGVPIDPNSPPITDEGIQPQRGRT